MNKVFIQSEHFEPSVDLDAAAVRAQVLNALHSEHSTECAAVVVHVLNLLRSEHMC